MPLMSAATSPAALAFDVEDGDLGAGRRQHPRGRGAEAGAPAGDEGRLSTNIHDQLACAVDGSRLRQRQERPATMTCGGGGRRKVLRPKRRDAQVPRAG